MANTPPNSSNSHPYGPQNPRVARRDNRLPRAGPYPAYSTLPELSARLHRHETRLEGLEREQRMMTTHVMAQVHERITHLQRQLDDINSIVEMLNELISADRGADEIYRDRLEECEQRSQEAEEHARVLEQRLTLAEDGARQTGRLAETVDRLVTLVSQLNLRQD